MVGRADYYERIEAKRERLEDRAERLSRSAAADFRKADLREEVSGIPFGQPILVGHHSEKRHRKAIERANNAMSRAIEADKMAGECAARAETYGTHGISSDNPDAIELLREKLAEREAKQATMKATNAAWRKAGHKAGRAPDGSWIEPPYAPYQLTNNSANIKRIKDRIVSLERSEQREHKEVVYDSGVRLVQNVEANRLQIFFPGKPSEAARKNLKQAGFRWSPTEGAWQRMLNNSAVWAARRVLDALAE